MEDHSGADPATRSAVPVQRLTDARTAVNGVDFTTTGTVHRPGTFLEGTLQDGRLVLSEGPIGTDRPILAAHDGTELALPRSLKGPYLGQDGSRLLFGQSASGADYRLYDLREAAVSPASSEPSHLSWGGSTEEQVIAGGTLYATDGAEVGGSASPLRELPLGGHWSTGSKVGAFTVRGSTLAYTDTMAGPSRTVTVHDLTGASDVTFRDVAPSNCASWDIALTADRVLVGSMCGDWQESEGDTINRIDVYTRTGVPVTTITGKAMFLAQNDGGVVTVNGRADGSSAAYVFSDDTVVRLPGATSGATTAGDLVSWQKAAGTYVTVRWH